MAKMVVRVKPYQGEYELDEDRSFTTNEWRWIKQVSGYMPLTVSEGFAGGDPALFVALSVVAMRRAGRITSEQVTDVADDLGDAPFDGEAITMVGDDVGDDADPPALTSEPDAPSPTGSLENQRSTGDSSRSGSVPSDDTRPVTSLLRSGTS